MSFNNLHLKSSCIIHHCQFSINIILYITREINLLVTKDIMNACEISKQKYILPVLGLLILPISFCSKPTKKLLKFQHFFHHLLLID